MVKLILIAVWFISFFFVFLNHCMVYLLCRYNMRMLLCFLFLHGVAMVTGTQLQYSQDVETLGSENLL